MLMLIWILILVSVIPQKCSTMLHNVLSDKCRAEESDLSAEIHDLYTENTISVPENLRNSMFCPSIFWTNLTRP